MPVRLRLRAPIACAPSSIQMERISSRQNTHVKQAHKLAESARERAKSGRTLLDGTRLIGAYIERFGLNAVMLLVNEHGARRPEVRQLIEAVEPRRVFLLADQLFDEISQVETPEGVTAIVEIPRIAAKSPDDFRVVLDGVQDPGNVGGLLRTAAASGATSAYLAKGCADAWSPKSLRGGMGAQFVLPVRESVDLPAALSGFEGNVIATSPRAKKSIFDVDLTGPVAMVFGGEGRGLGEAALGIATQVVHIPMAHKVESLNVAAAAAVCCFERLRQARNS
ncbi:MAG TPA: RNA methyltransferase [Burkholderiales bacterium]|nr:RNA methyltransferase [Burkholderiales bacterium]